jgi:hypothetical protein
MSQRHLSDDRLIELSLAAVAGDAAGVDVDHLVVCEPCLERRAVLTGLLAEVNTAAAAAADDIFTDERLERQRVRILQRIEQECRPGRVIAFPTASGREPALRAKPAMRWVAAASAAAFIVGVAAGHLVHDLPGAGPLPMQQSAVQAVAGTTMQGAAGMMSDDEFLGQIEAAVDSAGPSALRPLDALTPRAWDVR